MGCMRGLSSGSAGRRPAQMLTQTLRGDVSKSANWMSSNGSTAAMGPRAVGRRPDRDFRIMATCLHSPDRVSAICRAESDGGPQSASAEELGVRGNSMLQGNRRSAGTVAGCGHHFHGARGLVPSVFDEPARQARFGLRFNPFVNNFLHLLPKVGCPVQAGELDGFERWRGTFLQLFEFETIALPHGYIPPRNVKAMSAKEWMGRSCNPYGYDKVKAISSNCQ